MRQPYGYEARAQAAFPGFRPEIRNCLVRHGITSMRSLMELSDDEILEIRSFGPSRLAEIRAVIGPQSSDVITANWVGEGLPA